MLACVIFKTPFIPIGIWPPRGRPRTAPARAAGVRASSTHVCPSVAPQIFKYDHRSAPFPRLARCSHSLVVSLAQSLYSNIAQTWQKPSEAKEELDWHRKIEWRRSESFVRVERPLRLDRARALGYRAKPGYVVVRARVRRGSMRKRRWNHGRKPRSMGVNKITMAKSIQRLSEERTAKRYPNCEVLASYWVGDDGRHYYYEVILVDTQHPAIQNDPKINWICELQHHNRVFRGLTPSGKRGRGLAYKGKGSERTRPSVKQRVSRRSVQRTANKINRHRGR
jgi:large subunit ribosomal protein L15e